MDRKIRKVFDEFVAYVESEGCPVKQHWDKPNLEVGSNGFFTPDPHPHIEVALKGRPLDDCIILMIHEFNHYRQFQDRVNLEKYNEANILQDNLLNGGFLNPEEREFSRIYTQMCEYDCDMRTVECILDWNLGWIKTAKDHVKSANSYNRHIAWQIGCRKKEGSGIFMPNHSEIADVLWPNRKSHKIYTIDEATSPILESHSKLISKMKNKRKNPYFCSGFNCGGIKFR